MITLGDVVKVLSEVKGVVLVKIFNDYKTEHFKTIEVTYQSIPFERVESCHVLELRDISHLQKIQEQQQKL